MDSEITKTRSCSQCLVPHLKRIQAFVLSQVPLRVVEADVVIHRLLVFVVSVEGLKVEHLTLQDTQEPFHRPVVDGAADPRHALDVASL